jgi:hypothetical protein
MSEDKKKSITVALLAMSQNHFVMQVAVVTKIS